MRMLTYARGTCAIALTATAVNTPDQTNDLVSGIHDLCGTKGNWDLDKSRNIDEKVLNSGIHFFRSCVFRPAHGHVELGDCGHARPIS